MKLIFRLIKIILLLITLSPFILLAIMYKGYTIPADDFLVTEELSFTDIAARNLDLFLSDPSKESFEFTLTKNEANAAMKTLYAKDNPSFMSEDESLPKEDRLYAIKFGNFGGFKGANITFAEDELTITAGADAGFNGIYYKTTLKITLGLVIDAVELEDGTTQTVIKLAVKSVNIGNLPVFWMYDGANWLVKQIFKKSINEFIQQSIQGLGNFDLDTRTVVITSKDILGFVNNSNENAMLDAVFAMVDELELIESTFTDTHGGLKLELGKLRSTDAGYVLTSQLQNDQDVETLFTGQLSSLLVSTLLSNESTLKYNMHEMAFNQLLDYYVRDSMNISEKIELGGEAYLIQTEPLFARFVNNQVHFNIILKIVKESDPTKQFKTSFILKTTPSVNASDLVFTITEVGIGDTETVSSATIEKVLKLVGETDIIQGNQIILEDFLNEFATQGVTVKQISVNGSYLVFELEPNGTNASVLAELQDAISDALNDVLQDPEYADVLDAFEDFLANPTSNDTSGILDAINNLDPTQQSLLFDQLLDSLGDISNLGNLIP
ncbi:hypothetical protein [Acholeplasma hippikon]|uniref:Uncharacterized protein n=1 Tax=Acholeplasma hippikon TaxID=264636 RepID=A0A449BL22_9MOLU|nr:hypothetical protein [Acholeplasma hippikon]VEU83093.1 Uncharacterised protein [Acholeplasma hippikon]